MKTKTLYATATIILSFITLVYTFMQENALALIFGFLAIIGSTAWRETK